ncbi:MAG: hypothetical protein R2880_08825 [Deinococcales bacterium]
MEHFGDASRVLAASEQELAEVEGIGPKLLKSFLAMRESPEADKELRRASNLGIELISFADEGYPPALKHIYDPPMLLYVLGKLPESCLSPLKV